MRQTRFKKTNIIYILNITVPSKNDFSKINFTNNKNNILEKIYIDKICCIYIYILFQRYKSGYDEVAINSGDDIVSSKKQPTVYLSS